MYFSLLNYQYVYNVVTCLIKTRTERCIKILYDIIVRLCSLSILRLTQHQMSGVLCAYLLVLLSVPTSPSLASGLGLNPAALPHLLSNSSASQQLLSAMQPQQLLQAAQAAQAQAAQAVQAVQASQQPLLTTSPQQHSHRHTSHMNHYTVCMTDFWKALSLGGR